MSIKEIAHRNIHPTKRRKLSVSPEETDTDEGYPSGMNTESRHASSGFRGHSDPPQRPRRLQQRGQLAELPIKMPINGMTKSSTIALQLQELLRETTPDYDVQLSVIKTVTDKLEALIKAVPQQAPKTLNDAVLSLQKLGVAIPFSNSIPKKELQNKFEFRPPMCVSYRGALIERLSIKDPKMVDIVVEMPEAMFQEKDYSTDRAFNKRTFYLACIAAGVKEGISDEFEIEYELKDDLPMIPIIVLTARKDTPSPKKCLHYQYKIDVAFPHSVIPMDKTSPPQNAVRSTDSGGLTPSQTASPFYNSCIRSQSSHQLYDELVRNAKSSCTAFAESCRAGQIWLRQRGFTSYSAEGGFGYWEWTVICALLLHTGGHRGHALFSVKYNTLQLFKAMLQVLAGRDFLDPFILNASGLKLPTAAVPMLYDGKGGVNILFKMSPWSYQALRQQAQLTLTTVNARNPDTFDAIFVSKVAVPLLQYDEIYCFGITKAEGDLSNDISEVLQQLYAILSRGLGDRVTLIDLKILRDNRWSVAEVTDPTSGSNSVELRLITNSDAVSRLIDHGPPAEDEAAANNFRDFWGEKSELRRFKDGSINESLVWSSDVPVTAQIVDHLMALHFPMLAASLRTVSLDLDLNLMSEKSAINTPDGFRFVNKTFQLLSSKLHQLEGLPLPVRSVSAASSQLRFCSRSNPVLPSTTEPIDILIQFDSSARWPDSLPAIQHTKIAFLLKTADLLSSIDSSLTTRLGLEDLSYATNGHFNTSFLDIIYPSPSPGLSAVCFRARILHDRELHLLQTALADKNLHGGIRDSLSSALTTYKRDYVAKPIHTTTLQNLCTRYIALSPTIRLLKRWVTSHLLVRHIPEEIIEIVAANVFLRTEPWQIPGCATTAFLRCLYFLSRWEWTYTPLIVDLSMAQDMGEATISEIHTRFQAWRNLDPNMNNVTWFVGTNVDTTGTVWTQGSQPLRVVASRVKALASAVIELIKTKGTAMQSKDWQNIFISPVTTSDFDFLLHLKDSIAPSRLNGKNGTTKSNSKDLSTFKNLQIQEQLDLTSIGYDPVELYLKDLESSFGNVALFFFNPDGGNVIAGLLKPGVQGAKEWRVRQGFSSTPNTTEKEKSQEGNCQLNLKGILAEMAILGEGIVKNISMKDRIC